MLCSNCKQKINCFAIRKLSYLLLFEARTQHITSLYYTSTHVSIRQYIMMFSSLLSRYTLHILHKHIHSLQSVNFLFNKNVFIIPMYGIQWFNGWTETKPEEKKKFTVHLERKSVGQMLYLFKKNQIKKSNATRFCVIGRSHWSIDIVYVALVQFIQLTTLLPFGKVHWLLCIVLWVELSWAERPLKTTTNEKSHNSISLPIVYGIPYIWRDEWNA